jgi:hydrogenase expression/formation protein HypD
MEVIAQEPTSQVQAFLAAGHVCTVAGHQVYDSFCERHRLPVVVTGFEPVDLLEGIWECVRQLEAGESHVVNAYRRSVREAGNESGRRCRMARFGGDFRGWLPTGSRICVV